VYYRSIKFSFIFFLLIYFTLYSHAQVYHYITGEIIPEAKAGHLRMESGTFLGYDADFGVLIVPENRLKPHVKLINIPVIRVKALNDTANIYPIFLLNGGPGTSNIWYDNFPEYLLEDHDIVMVGYRGVEGSVILECPDVKEIIKNNNIFDEENFQNLVRTWENEADKFQRKHIDIEGYGKHEVIYDIENVRQALGYDRINIYSFSYGTMLAQFYIYLYPDKANKMVLLGARPFGYYLHDPFVINTKFNQFVNNLKINSEIDNVHFDPELTFRTICKENSYIENSKLELAAFQHLYSYSSSKYLVKALIEGKNEDYKRIKSIYATYSNEFTGDLMLGDYAIKTSCSASFYDYDSIAFFPPDQHKRMGHFLTESINRWYLSFNLCYRQFNLDFFFKPNNTETLFISAEYDFVAPHEFVKNKILPYYENSEFFLLSNMGHDDLIDNKSRFLMNKIISFYED